MKYGSRKGTSRDNKIDRKGKSNWPRGKSNLKMSLQKPWTSLSPLFERTAATIYTAISSQRSLLAPAWRGRIIMVQSINTIPAWNEINDRAYFIIESESGRMCSMWTSSLLRGELLTYWRGISVWTSMLLPSLLNTITKTDSPKDSNTRNRGFESQTSPL